MLKEWSNGFSRYSTFYLFQDASFLNPFCSYTEEKNCFSMNWLDIGMMNKSVSLYS